MATTIPLGKMTTSEKLYTMEVIWQDLQRTSDSVISPEWHADILKGRVKKVKEGLSKFRDWSAAKERIRKRVK